MCASTLILKCPVTQQLTVLSCNWVQMTSFLKTKKTYIQGMDEKCVVNVFKTLIDSWDTFLFYV